MTDDLPETAAPVGKGPEALRTIGEVAALLGIRQHVLRYWEDQFPMLRPVKRSGNRRYYRPTDVDLLRTIHRLVDGEGYTLRGARLAIGNGLADGVPRPAADGTVVEVAAEDSDSSGAADRLPVEAIAALRQIRQTLAQALAAA